MRLVFVIISATIAYLCLYPWHFDPARSLVQIRWDPPHRAADWVDAFANVLLFIPLGIAGILGFAKHRNLAAGLICLGCGMFSYGIETAQRFLPGRSSSFRDVACNTLGGIIGVGIGYSMTRWRFWERAYRPLQQAPFAILLTFFWTIAFTYPCIPILRMPGLRRSWNALLYPEFAWMRLIDIVLMVLLMNAIYRTVFAGWRRPARGALVATAILLAVFPLQTVLHEFTFSLPRTVAGGLGLAVAHRYGNRIPLRLLFFTLLGWIVIRGLWPFHFSQASPAIFSWIPFQGLFIEGQSSVIRSIAGKWLLYAGTVWVARQSGLRWWHATLLVCVPVAALEWLQRWIPGRTPEISDPILVLAGALAIPFNREPSSPPCRAHR
ncbi:MAG: VanZ family protein [Acidobacteria bacterium]|nr:VanZ family protein [Acidobacteriota bacterium]